MKHLLYGITIAFLLLSCSKSQQDLSSDKITHTYTLNFQMENESNGSYYIQTSKDGINFASIDSLPYDPAKYGNYNYDLNLKTGEFVRIAVGNNNDSTQVFSQVMKAN